MSVESEIEKMTNEINSLKATFEQSAAMMQMIVTEITFSTSMNSISFTNPSYDPLKWQSLISLPKISATVACGLEPVIVTFDCDAGINTFATLEIERPAHTPLDLIATYRLPYSGGAKWMVTVNPNVTPLQSGYYSWQSTTLRFVVKSAAAGQLGAKMIWQ